MAKDIKEYQNALADMNNEAVEYVRGVPVVKTFGQTVHSFAQFKTTIDNYYKFAVGYCKKCRTPILMYTVFINSAFAFLIVLALILAGGGPVTQHILLNFVFYVIFTPIIATAMSKVMYMSENGMIVADALSRIHSILDAEVMQAAKEAMCDGFIAKLPQGYQTMIGENGSTLSGGERQRISIARALLKDAPMILLDEATASLDAENETEIQQAISRLVEQKAVLIIAHRMRTVENADKIVVLSGGRVAEMGTPDELMKKNGAFARMVKLQTESQNWVL